MPEATQNDPRVYFAAERTFLAWIRTSLALMGLGFVVARFGLFLAELQATQSRSSPRLYGYSPIIGIAIVVLGVVVCISATLIHMRQVRDLSRGAGEFNRPSPLAISLAVLLALAGIAMAVYLAVIRNREGINLKTSQEVQMPTFMENGIVSKPSSYTVDQTVEKLKAILQAKGVTLFALVDHSGEAERAGLKMPPTKLLIFGSPKAGTPLMLASPSIAIDLPLKILVSQDAAGKVWMSYNAPDYLESRHHLPHELLQNIAVVEALVAKAAESSAAAP